MRWIIGIDILGFQGFAKKVSEHNGVDVEEVRRHLVRVIKQAISDLREKRVVLGKKYGQDDSWILVTDKYDHVATIITTLLGTPTAYKRYRTIPLEICAGTVHHPHGVKLRGLDLVVDEETMAAIKENPFDRYRSWFKGKNAGRHVISSYAVLTSKAFEALEGPDRRIYSEIRDRYGSLFVADLEQLRLRGAPRELVLHKFKEHYPWSATIETISKEAGMKSGEAFRHIQALRASEQIEPDGSQGSKLYRYVHPDWGLLGPGPLKPSPLTGPVSSKKRRLTYDDIAYVLENKLVPEAKKTEPEAIFSINRGGSIVGGLLAKQLQTSREEKKMLVPHVLHVIRPEGADRARVVPHGGFNGPKVKRALLVDDTYYHGHHMRAALKYLKENVYRRRTIQITTLVLLWNASGFVRKNPPKPIELDIWGYQSFANTLQPWDPET